MVQHVQFVEFNISQA